VAPEERNFGDLIGVTMVTFNTYVKTFSAVNPKRLLWVRN